MNEFLKNQRNAFFVLIGALFAVSLFWYFIFHHNVQSLYEESLAKHSSISQNRDLYKNMKIGLPSVEAKWDSLNTSFQDILNKIPYKRNYDHASNALYDLLIKHNFDVGTFSPSKVPLEKKVINIPNSQKTILVEKYPIDIQMKGNFIQLGKFLDAMKTLPYRITASNIQIKNGRSEIAQNIKLITYVYLQSGQKGVNTVKAVPKKKKPINKPKKSTPKPKTNIVQNTQKVQDTKDGEKKPEPNNNSENISSDYSLEKALICEEIDLETNGPILPGESFPVSIGRLYCFTTVTKQNRQNGTISHNWYSNNELMYRVLINIKQEGLINAISKYDFNFENMGQWKVVILDSDKNVLETINFELV